MREHTLKSVCWLLNSASQSPTRQSGALKVVVSYSLFGNHCSVNNWIILKQFVPLPYKSHPCLLPKSILVGWTLRMTCYELGWPKTSWVETFHPHLYPVGFCIQLRQYQYYACLRRPSQTSRSSQKVTSTFTYGFMNHIYCFIWLLLEAWENLLKPAGSKCQRNQWVVVSTNTELASYSGETFESLL